MPPSIHARRRLESADAVEVVTRRTPDFWSAVAEPVPRRRHRFRWRPAPGTSPNAPPSTPIRVHFNALNQHATGNVHTAATSTDAAGLLARPQGESVTVTVNGQAAELNPVPSGLYDSTSNYLSLVAALSAGADSLAWHAQDIPLAPGSNQIKVRAATASGRVLEQTNTVILASAPVFGYDANGNMTNDSHFVYTWNDEDRLVSAAPVALTNGARKVEHVYDWMGRRILRTVSKFENNAWSPDNQTRYVYQEWNVNWESITHAQEPQETNWYFWGLDLSGRPQGAGGVGGLLAVWRSIGDFISGATGATGDVPPQSLTKSKTHA